MVRMCQNKVQYHTDLKAFRFLNDDILEESQKFSDHIHRNKNVMIYRIKSTALRALTSPSIMIIQVQHTGAVAAPGTNDSRDPRRQPTESAYCKSLDKSIIHYQPHQAMKIQPSSREAPEKS